jgi:hypothetical protein
LSIIRHFGQEVRRIWQTVAARQADTGLVDLLSQERNTMKHISIGGLDVSRIGLGAMSMSGYYNIGAGSDAESIRTIQRALTWASPTSTPRRSMARTPTRNW